MKKVIVLLLLISTLFSAINVSQAFATTAGIVVINEVELNPAGSDAGAEQVELYNPSSNPVDVSGWTLTSTAGTAATVTIGQGTSIPANGHLLLVSGTQWLDNAEEGVVLSDDSGDTIDSAGPFSDSDNDNATWQRSPDGDEENWVFNSETLGGPNFGTFVTEPSPQPMPEPPASPPVGELKIVFIDVGQGNSELIILPNNKTILIDGGERDQTDEVLAALQEHGVTAIETVIATHPHADHIGGLIGVINDIEVGQVVDSGQVHNTQTFEDLLDAIEANQIPLISVHDGDNIELDPSVQIDVLNPPATLPVGADDEDEFNNNSVAVKLTYGEFSAILTGDMEQENEARLSGMDIDSDVLLAGHHGSRTSSSAAFLAAVSPEVVVISLGAGNTYGHPHQEALDRMDDAGVTHVFRTDMDGTVVLTTTGSGEYTIETMGSDRVVVMPEFGTAMFVAAISLISVVVVINRGRIWNGLSRQA